MPTVPTSFLPSVAPASGVDIGQFQAPQVAVAENLAAEQEARFGQAMTQAGNVAFRVGSAIQDDIDEAQTKETDTWWLGQANEILKGKSGYLRTTGKDADAAYQQASDALSASAEQAMGRLQNDTQRAMFKGVLARNMMAFQGQMTEHRDREVKVYATNESKARAERYAQLAVDDWANRDMPLSSYQINRGVALAEIRKAGALAGIEEGSAQMQALERTVNTQITGGVANRLMMDSQYDEAWKFVKGQIKAGEVDDKVGENLLASIDVNRDRWMIDQYATNIRQFGRVGMADDKDNDPKKAPASARDAMDIADGIKDPEIRKGVQVMLKQQYAQEAALAKQEYEGLVDQTEQFLATPGNTYSMLPLDVVAKLKPKDRQTFMANQLRKDDLDVQEELARNPALLTREWIDRNRSKMTPETAIRLLKDAADPEKVLEATFDADMFKETAMNNGMSKLVTPKSDADKAQSFALRNDIKQRIDIEQRRRGAKLSRDEKQAIIDSVFMQATEEAKVERSWMWDYSRPLAQLTDDERRRAYVQLDMPDGIEIVRVDDVPATWTARVAIPAFKAAGVQYPSFRQIAELWIKKGSPSQ